MEDNHGGYWAGGSTTFLGIEGDKEFIGDGRGSDVKQTGKEWHRIVPAEFWPLGEHSCILYICFNSNTFSFFLSSHPLFK